jgi:hypothetical protein
MIKGFYQRCIVYCNKTSKSKSSKPIQGNFYIVHKRVNTKWGDKIICSDENGDEIWGDPSYLDIIDLRNYEDSLKERLFSGYEKFLDKIYTPAICTIIKKNHAGIEVEFSNGVRCFLTSKLVRKYEEANKAKVKEIIPIEIPVWYAEKQQIIKRAEQ